MSCWVWEAQNNSTSTKPHFPPMGLETRMFLVPWGGWYFYRLVAFDPLLPWDLQISLFKSLERETKRTYTESDATGQLEPRAHIDIKSCERRTLFYKKGGNVAWGLFPLREVAVQWTFLENHSVILIRTVSYTFVDEWLKYKDLKILLGQGLIWLHNSINPWIFKETTSQIWKCSSCFGDFCY